jgi:prepilin-type processing-associated H-X9-DG protein
MTHQGTPFSYGYNNVGTAASLYHGVPISLGLGNEAGIANGFEEPKLSQVAVPADMIAIADSGVWPLSIQPRHASLGGTLPTFPYNEEVGNVHFGGPNILFCDGHVQRFALSEVAFLVDYPDMNTVDHLTIMWNRNHLPISQLR